MKLKLLLLPIFLVSFAFTAFGANTHSIDIERTSSQYLFFSSHFGVESNESFTLECWIKPEVNDGFAKTCVSFSDDTPDIAYAIYHDDGILAFKREKLGVGSTVISYASYPTSGTWWHVVGTYDGTNLRLYQAPVGGTHTLRAGPTSATGAGSSGGIEEFRIGGALTTAEVSYDGLVDEVRFWDYQRTIEELDADFEQELCGDETGLLVYWQLDNTLIATSLGTQTLTNNNSAVFEATVPFVTDTCTGGEEPVATTTATTTPSFTDDEQFVIMIAVFFMSLMGTALLFSPFKAK